MKNQISLDEQLSEMTTMTKEFRQVWNDMRLESERLSQEALESFQSFIKSSKLKGKTIADLLEMGFELTGTNRVVLHKKINKAVITRVWDVKGEITSLSTRTVMRMEYMNPIGCFTCPLNVKFPDGKIGKLELSYRGGSRRIFIKRRAD